MSAPHSAWAEYYDTAYDLSFGRFYEDLTLATLEQIERKVFPPASIVDFGAGTGRLSIPLAKRGYRVVAVEPCREMLCELSRKAGEAGIRTFLGRMQDFRSADQYDMAICVFTVLLYLLDEESLEKSVKAVARVVRPGGFLLIDVPSLAIFRGYHRCTLDISRRVTVTPQGNDLYLYEENTTVQSAGNPVSYSDTFLVRYWEVKRVMELLSNSFSIEKDLSDEFSGSGSRYFLLKRKRN